jgi:phosphoribosyl 1,2-cyclic phosphodiesterase
MDVTVLASGSGGNACLFSDGTTRVLVDAGIPLVTLRARLKATQQQGPHAVVITHAHGDHHRYAAEIALHFQATLWVTEATRRVVAFHGAPMVRVYSARHKWLLETMTVSPMEIPHDAPQVSLKLTGNDGCSAVIATDLGEVPNGLLEHVRGCDTLLIESNHDERMLWNGPYSYSLKRRIASSRGHLSNTQTAAFLTSLPSDIQTVALMHLSEKNNTPALALEVAAEALASHPARLLLASQDFPLQIVSLRKEKSF